VDWGFFKLLFVENKGMAMGTKLNDFIPFISENSAKLILTLFRLVAISGLGYWLWDSIKKTNEHAPQLGIVPDFCWGLRQHN